MAQKKMGRPPIGEKPLKDRIFIRVDDETKRKLKICTEKLDMTISNVVRKGIDQIFDGLEK